MLGLGGGTSLRTLRHLLPDLEITTVEIDPEMIALARHYMGLDKIGAEVVADDAYAWLRRNRRKYDVIFDDVYGVSATDVYRPEVYTDELRQALFRSMKPDGIFGVNLVLGAGHRRMQSNFRAFFRKNFDVVRSVTTPESLNETLMGGKALAPWRDIRALGKHFTEPSDYGAWRVLRGRALGA
jgi:spermidine synthase